MTRRILAGYISNIPGSGLDNYLFGLLELLTKKSGEKEPDVAIDLLSSEIDQPLIQRWNGYAVRFLPINRLRHPLRRYRQIRKYCQENDYDLAYFNISEAFNCIGNLAAWKYVHPVITHSHSAGSDTRQGMKRRISRMLNTLCRPVINRHTDARFACSDKAAAWLYGDRRPYRLIRNTVEAKRFVFDPDQRKQWRTKLMVDDSQPLIGFVGSLSYQKHPEYLIDLLQEIRKTLPEVRLVLAGDGPLAESLQQETDNSVIFLGSVADVSSLYSAMDLFVLPSRFEGYPLVGVEAQISGLPCLFSESITRQIALNDASSFFDPDGLLEKTAAKACSILTEQMNLSEDERKRKRTEAPEQLQGDYDWNQQASMFTDIFVNGNV